MLDGELVTRSGLVAWPHHAAYAEYRHIDPSAAPAACLHGDMWEFRAHHPLWYPCACWTAHRLTATIVAKRLSLRAAVGIDPHQSLAPVRLRGEGGTLATASGLGPSRSPWRLSEGQRECGTGIDFLADHDLDDRVAGEYGSERMNP